MKESLSLQSHFCMTEDSPARCMTLFLGTTSTPNNSLPGLSPSQLFLSGRVQPTLSARATGLLLPYSRQPERSTRYSTSANMFNALRLHRGTLGKKEMTSK